MYARFDSTCPRCHGKIRADHDLISRPPGMRYYVHVRCPEPQARPTFRQAEPLPAEILARKADEPGENVYTHSRLTVEDSGVYVLPDSTIVRVKANQSKTGVYPTTWTIIPGLRWTEDDTRVHGEYKYVEDWQARRALMDRVKAEGRKMSWDEALAFATLHAQCARCSRRLTDADSVMDGMGSKCIEYFGGKHGQTRKARGKSAAPIKTPVPAAQPPRSYADVFPEDDAPAERFDSDGHPALATAATFPKAAARDARLKALRARYQQVAAF